MGHRTVHPFFVDIYKISKVARHLVMKNKNWNLLQLEMGKYFQRIITIFIDYCERFEPRSHLIDYYVYPDDNTQPTYDYLHINCLFRN